MCTSIAYHGKNFCFGRNMDLEYSFGERIIACGRSYPLKGACGDVNHGHFAIIGVGTVIDGYPMYADAMNECGLCAAGLNFPACAHFPKSSDAKVHISPYELIPFVLSRCASVDEVKSLLSRACIVDVPFSESVPNATLHWHIADRHSSITVESTTTGLCVFDNTAHVLTNSPHFDRQMSHLELFSRLTPAACVERRLLGIGAVGLPGDLSSPSRFVRAAFLLGCLPDDADGDAACDRLLSVLSAVAMTDGAVTDAEGNIHRTTYSSCARPSEQKYTVKWAGRLSPVTVSLADLDIDSASLTFPTADKRTNI